jgi:hypothetical protein
MNLRSIVSSVVLVALAGCSHEVREPAPPANHPANPQAASAPAPSPKMSSTLNPSDTDVTPAQSTSAGAPAAGSGASSAAPSAVPVVYTCPHHPKVMEAEPGECPFCGMKLVPTNSRNTSPVRGVEPETPAPTTPGGAHAGHEGHAK